MKKTTRFNTTCAHGDNSRREDLPVLAILHPSFELLALLGCHIAESFFHRLLAVLAFEELFSLLRRHIFPAFLQLPFFIRRQVVEPFAGAA